MHHLHISSTARKKAFSLNGYPVHLGLKHNVCPGPFRVAAQWAAMFDLYLSFQLLLTFLYTKALFAPVTHPEMDPGKMFPTTNDKHMIDGILPMPASPLPQDASVIVSHSLPNTRAYIPEVGNGHVATVIRSNTVFMNGLYNGANYSSHRARVPSTVGFKISHTSPSGLQENYTIDFGRGFFTESRFGDGVSFTLRTYAHRVWTHVIVSELILTRENASTEVMVAVNDNQGPESDDLDFHKEADDLWKGITREAEYPEIAPKTSFYIKTSSSLKGHHVMPEGQKSQTIAAFTSIGVHKDTVLDHYEKAAQALKYGTLLSSHVEEWEKIWQKGRVDIEGDLKIARITYGALYYLYSSLPFNGSDPNWPFIGMSPGGLAHGVNEDDYGGHVFWDQDTWMFPGLALLNAEFGRLIVGTRTRTFDSAKILAASTGWQGARYPWESAFTGLETCPGEVYADLEIHISGDVAMMMRQYWELTGDSGFFLNEGGYDVLQGVCTYFASRVTHKESDDTYHIKGVMPPDEYHEPVDDSVYTNFIAAAAFRFTNNISSIFGRPENATWSEIADKLVIEYDPHMDYHPEFKGYRHGDTTKQADVVMLSYPLMMSMNDSTKINDLTEYEKTTPVGPAPAMTWSIFLTNWLELGNETKAAELFKRSILNAQEPFYVWSENSDGSGATNFLTGMGGHLQALLFGYGGCRIHADTLAFDPKMIPGTTKITFTDLDYMGSNFFMSYNESTLSVVLTFTRNGQSGLQIKLAETGTWKNLTIGTEVSAHRQSFELRKIKTE